MIYPPTTAKPLHAVLFMLASGLSFVGVNAIVRWLGTDLPSAQSAFIRFCFGLFFTLPATLSFFRAGVPASTVPLFVGRGFVHTAAVLFWFYAMAHIPVVEAVAIGYLNPILVTLGGIVLLGDRLSGPRIVAISCAVMGALIILRPGGRELELGHLSQVGAAFCFAGSYIYAKKLSLSVPAGAVVAMMSVSVAIGLLPFALYVWQPVTLYQLAALACVACFATMGHYFMSRAFTLAPLSVTQPVTFLQLLWASLLGAYMFQETLDYYVVLGALVIIGGISFMTWREAQG